MKTQNLASLIPIDLILAYDDLGDPNLRPPDHVVNVARIHKANPRMGEVSDEVGAWVTQWATEQLALADLATDLANRLDLREPVPTPASVIDGTAVWPEWHLTWWGKTLRFQWAGRLAEAVVEGEAWLDQRA